MRARALAIILLATLAAAGPAHARTTISPYIEVEQTLDVDVSGDRDTTTYTSVAGGVDVSASARLIDATASAFYEHRFSETGEYGDDDIYSGLAQARMTVVPNLLTIEGGAIATRTRADIRGAAPGPNTGDLTNLTQVYAGYIGPDLSTDIGPISANAGYRYGYVHADDKQDLGLPAGQRRLDSFDSAHSQTAYASLGMSTRNLILPFGWTLSGAWEREDASQLDQRYDGKYARADVTVPVLPTLAVQAGVGYENIRISQKAPKVDADGNFVVDSNGRYVADDARGRKLAYDTDGLIYDAGVLWKPSPRLTLEAKVGKRYGQTAVTGSLDWQTSASSGLQIGVFNEVDSFGRGLTRDIQQLPTQFDVPRGDLTNRFNGCVFGKQAGQGGCFNDALQSVSTSNYRSRGIYALFGVSRGRVKFGVGGGYAERRYLAPIFDGLFSVDGVKDRSWDGQAEFALAIDPVTQFDTVVYVDYYQSGIAGSPDVLSGGATASLYRQFGSHLSGSASVGLYYYDQRAFDSDLAAAGRVGARYDFF